MELPFNCTNCEHFDGDAFCSLPDRDKLVTGYIREAELVTCGKYEQSAGSRHLALLKAEDAAKADDERSLYRHARY
jgi:hypothetical protein